MVKPSQRMHKDLPISRRNLLRGMGVAMAVPLMESLAPRGLLAAVPSATASAAGSPKRLSVFYTPNGVRMPQFTPLEAGSDYELTNILQPLARHKDRFTVVSGMAHNQANAFGDPPAGHGRSCPAFLTGVHVKATEGSDIQCGISMDQVVANHVGQDTQLPSLQLGIEPSSLLGSCDINYSCTYTNTISWRNETSALPVQVNPGDVFVRLFGDNMGLDESARKAQLATKASLLDFVMEDAARMSRNLGANDKRKLDEYLDAVRSVERRIQKAAEQKLDIDPGDLTVPAGIPDDFQEHVRIMIDLQVLALQTDMTRVSTFMLGRELSNRAYPEIGVPDSHHSLSHHGNNPEKIAKLVKIDQYHMDQLAYYLDRLASTPDGEGNLLDSTIVLAGACLGEPNEHDNMNLPALVAGGGIPGNRHIMEPTHTPMCNLLLSLIQEMGVPAEQFGDSTGTIEGLRA